MEEQATGNALVRSKYQENNGSGQSMGQNPVIQGNIRLFSQSFASSPTPQAPTFFTRPLPKRETEKIVAEQGRTWSRVKAGSPFQNSLEKMQSSLKTVS